MTLRRFSTDFPQLLSVFILVAISGGYGFAATPAQNSVSTSSGGLKITLESSFPSSPLPDTRDLRSRSGTDTVADSLSFNGSCGPQSSLPDFTRELLDDVVPVKKEDLVFYCPSRVSRNSIGIRPESYGATGNDSRDDTTALLAAAEAATQSNAYLVLTAGRTYITSKQISFQNGARGIIVRGRGKATIQASRRLPGWMILLQSLGRQTSISDFVIQDVVFDMNFSGHYAIWGQNPSRIGIYDSRFVRLGVNNGGIFFRAYDNFGDIKDVCIERNVITARPAKDQSEHGIYIDGDGILLGDRQVAYWKRNKGVPRTKHRATRIRISENEITGGYYGVSLTETSYSLISKNKVSDNLRNIKLQQLSHHNVIDSNICLKAQSTSMLLTYMSSHNVITNNRCRSTVARAWGMIELTLGSKGNIVANNLLRSPTPQPSHYYGVYMGVHVDQNYVLGNEITGYFSRAHVAVESSWDAHPDPRHRSNGSRWQNRGSRRQKIIANTFRPASSASPLIFLGQVSESIKNTDIKCNIVTPAGDVFPERIYELQTSPRGITGGDSEIPFY